MFLRKPCVSLIYYDIFTIFQKILIALKNMSVYKIWPDFEKENGSHNYLFENH